MNWEEPTRQKVRLWVSELERRWSADSEAELPDPQARAMILTVMKDALDHPSVPDTSAESTRYLERLAHHFSGEEVHFRDSSQIREFCERIRKSVALLVGEFQDLLAGRKKVQNDWSLYSSTAAMGDQVLKTRDIRLGDLHGDLGQALFDWRHPEATEEAVSGLKQALEELKHHQLATMAGYERSVAEGSRSLLDRLDPASVEREYVGKSDDESHPGAKSLRRYLPFRGHFLWRVYQKRFSQVTSEDAHWYQRQFLPAFRQGYRDYMVSRTGGGADGTPARAREQK